MIISHRLQFAFFRVPKTGSTTMEFLLRQSDVFDQNDVMTGVMVGDFPPFNTPDYDAIVQTEGNIRINQSKQSLHMHLTPEEAISEGYITQAQLEQYSVFACVRNPVDRYVSAFRHSNRKFPDPSMFIVAVNANATFGILTRPTVEYVYSNGVRVCDVLDFDNFQTELRRMLATVGADIFPLIPSLNVRRGPFMNANPTNESYWTPDLKTTMRENNTEDVALYNSMKAGTLE